MRVAMDTGGTFTDCVFLRRRQTGNSGKCRRSLKSPGRRYRCCTFRNASKFRRQSRGRVGFDLRNDGWNQCAAGAPRRNRVLFITTAMGFRGMCSKSEDRRAQNCTICNFTKRRHLLPSVNAASGARERVAADGSVLRKLSPADIRSLVQKVRGARPDAVAICLLFSFRNPKHEALAAKALRRAGALVSVSHEILPEFREFERTSTTVINAYLAPVMSSYLSETQTHAKQAWSGGPDSKSSRAAQVRVMQSNGGIISAASAAAQPVRTVLSGPAGGVLGAAYAASLADLERVITFDMGGTSTDVALLSGETKDYDRGARRRDFPSRFRCSKFIPSAPAAVRLRALRCGRCATSRIPGKRGRRPGANVLRRRRLADGD